VCANTAGTAVIQLYLPEPTLLLQQHSLLPTASLLASQHITQWMVLAVDASISTRRDRRDS
jgi:hypothetical protein